tara:strand:+ start:122 stop:379 length:258 start_codon:yes stop_codon:yes gene_type:complete
MDQEKSTFSLRETYVNPDHILYLRENNDIKSRLSKSNLVNELDIRQEVTTVHLNKGHSGMTINVIGHLSLIEEKIRSSKKILLKG